VYVLVALCNTTEMAATDVAVLPVRMKEHFKETCVVPEVKKEKHALRLKKRGKDKEIGKEIFLSA